MLQIYLVLGFWVLKCDGQMVLRLANHNTKTPSHHPTQSHHTQNLILPYNKALTFYD